LYSPKLTLVTLNALQIIKKLVGILIYAVWWEHQDAGSRLPTSCYVHVADQGCCYWKRITEVSEEVVEVERVLLLLVERIGLLVLVV
jgi:hypothetical protein